jgi:SAM-dependent methyltransferase
MNAWVHAPPALDDAATSQHLKACCAAVYESDWVRALLGDSLHPGGTWLTDRLAELLDIGPGSRVLDLAAGRGHSAISLASRIGCRVVGIDLSAANVAVATERAAPAGVDGLTAFRVADAESLEDDQGFDSVICECAFCLFPDKAAAARNISRLLRPGGRIGMSDLTRSGDLPHELDTLLAWVACIAAALPLSEYEGHLRDAGLRIDAVERHDDALLDMAERVRERLLGAAVLSEIGRLPLARSDMDAARTLAAAAVAIRDGRLGYALVCASKPAQSSAAR